MKVASRENVKGHSSNIKGAKLVRTCQANGKVREHWPNANNN